MALLELVLQVVAVVVACHLLGLLAVLDPGALRAGWSRARSNLSTVLFEAVALGAVLSINGLVRDVSVELSWMIGVNITAQISGVEGRLVAHLQSVASPPLTVYFASVYVFGYVFLLTFPLVAYVLHSESRPLRVLLVAYILNYTVGLLCYVLFVAYGPRNFMPELVEPLLFTSWPQSQLLTRQVNVNTNVFPSLHASLSVTVALVAYRFRTVHRRWVPVAGVLAASIAVSTMYLGIHWVTDVVAGTVVAALSVAVALRTTASEGPDRRRWSGVRTVRRWLESVGR
jgi:membrane-associated phospholipid phosphatase